MKKKFPIDPLPPNMEVENDFPNMPDLDDDEAYYTMLKGMNVDASTWFGKNAKARAKYEAWLKANPDVLG